MSSRTVIFGLYSRVISSSVRNLTPKNVKHSQGLFGPSNGRPSFKIPSVYTTFARYKSMKIVSDDAETWEDDFSDESKSHRPEARDQVWKQFDDFGDEDTDMPQSRNYNDNYDERRPQRNFRNNRFQRQDRYGRSFSREFDDSFRGRRNNDKFFNSRNNSQYRPRERFSRSDRFPDRFDDRFDDRSRRDNRMGEFNSMEDLWEELSTRKTDFSKEVPIQKDFYEEHPNVTERSKEEVEEFMKTHQMSVTGPNVKKPILDFEETGFSDEIQSMLKRMDFDRPTPIQSIGWPHALSGSDIVGIAQTGSGKTLSFMLPAILHIQAQKKVITQRNGPIVLVICPTRELARQCHNVTRPFEKMCNIRSTVVYGGASKMVQADYAADPGLDILIATPGRLLDFLREMVVNLSQSSYIVLDEADRMLDMGFEPQIRSIMEQIRPERQVLMWSATWPEEIQDLAMDFLKDYIHVKIGSQSLVVNQDINHEFEVCTMYDKKRLILEHLRNNRDKNYPAIPAKTLIFSRTKVGCSRIEFLLRSEGIRVAALHGDKSQRQRDDVMFNFRSGRYPVLVATDVAARGLDVSNIEYVINFDFPPTLEGYIHRVGRTARAGKKGTAISYITMDDLTLMPSLIKMLEEAGKEVPQILYKLEDTRVYMTGKKKRSMNNMKRKDPYQFKY